MNNNSPWFNNSLRKLKTEKRRLERQWMKSGIVHIQMYVKHITEYYSAVKASNTEFYNNKVADVDQIRFLL